MAKNRIEVIIGGAIYALQGEESEEHIQKVARLINDKLLEIQEVAGKTKLTSHKANMLVALNVADEYVKTKQQLEARMDEFEKCSAENAALKQRIQELSLEITRTREQLAVATHSHNKKDYTNRGR